MPTKKEGEKRDEFISRCMSDEQMKKEFKDREQRIAVCFSYWNKDEPSSNNN